MKIDPSKIQEVIDAKSRKTIQAVRVKSGKFFVRASRQDLNRGFNKPGEHRFFRLEMDYDEALEKLETLKEKIKSTRESGDVILRNFNFETDGYNFQILYNTIFFTSPDPTREISYDEVKGFPEDRTIIAWLYNQMTGFIYVTVEEDPLGTGKTVGAIAGIGVLAKHRGKKIGAKLLEYAIEYFRDKNVEKLICEVYDKNVASLRMFQSLGMRIVGEMILEQVQPDRN